MSWEKGLQATSRSARCPRGGTHVYPQLKGDENRTCLKCGQRKKKP